MVMRRSGASGSKAGAIFLSYLRHQITGYFPGIAGLRLPIPAKYADAADSRRRHLIRAMQP